MGSSIKSLVGPAIGYATGNPLLGQMAGAAISGGGAKQGANTQIDKASELSEKQYQATLPKNVSSLLGEFTYDDETRQAKISLTPELEDAYKRYLDRSRKQSELISTYDPNAYAEQFYQEQLALAAPGEEQRRIDLENRLRAQGLLGSTTGMQRTRSLYEAQDIKDLRRRAEARTAGQQQLSFMRGLESGDLSTATGIAGLGGDLSNIGMGIGSNLGSAVGAGAAREFEAAQNLADAQSSFWSKIGSTVGDAIGGGGLMGSTVTPFTSGGYSGNVVTPSAAYRAANPNVGASFVPVQMQGGVPVPSSGGLFGNIGNFFSNLF